MLILHYLFFKYDLTIIFKDKNDNQHQTKNVSDFHIQCLTLKTIYYEKSIQTSFSINLPRS